MGDDLLDQLKLLSAARFAELLYRLRVNPAELRSGSQTEQAIELLRLLEQPGQKAGRLERELARFAPPPSLPPSRPAQAASQWSVPGRPPMAPSAGKEGLPGADLVAKWPPPPPSAQVGAEGHESRAEAESLNPRVTTLNPAPLPKGFSARPSFALTTDALKGGARTFALAFIGALATLAAGLVFTFAKGQFRRTQQEGPPASAEAGAHEDGGATLAASADPSASAGHVPQSVGLSQGIVPKPDRTVAFESSSSPSSRIKQSPSTDNVAPAVASGPSPAHSDACAAACGRLGLCVLGSSGCVAGADADCQQSQACKSNAHCTRQGDVCAMVSDADRVKGGFCAGAGRCVALGARCVARSDDDCAQSSGCRSSSAQCTRRDDDCALVSDRDCRTAGLCEEQGFCTVAGRRCVAASNDDCRRSRACRDVGECTAIGGKCVKGGG